MESGILVYKCRRCNKLQKNTHVPKGMLALTSILHDGETPNEWGVMTARNTDIHFCEDNNLGICDLIGFEYDKNKTL